MTQIGAVVATERDEKMERGDHLSRRRDECQCDAITMAIIRRSWTMQTYVNVEYNLQAPAARDSHAPISVTRFCSNVVH